MLGTVMDNTDCTASYSQVFSNQQHAEAMLAALSEKARAVESDLVTSAGIKPVDGGVQLEADSLRLPCGNPDLPARPALIPALPRRRLPRVGDCLPYIAPIESAPARSFDLCRFAKCNRLVNNDLIRSDLFCPLR